MTPAVRRFAGDRHLWRLRRWILAVAVAVAVVCHSWDSGDTAVATAADARDWRTWPFASASPWNHPIGTGAHYAELPQLRSLAVGINYDDRWTSSIVIARENDPRMRLAFNGGTWAFLHDGGKVCGNSLAAETRLRKMSLAPSPPPANPYSTISTPDSSLWVLPPVFKPSSVSYIATPRVPANACASPDTDALMAVFQPDGWVLDLYGAVVLSDYSIVAAIGSFIDARGDGTGWWNGRRASMLPSFAGLVRNGELTARRIPHALAVTMSPTLLKEEAVWPAYAFDRNSTYSGALPMGSLLAIPPHVDLDSLGLSPKGKALARAAQWYGVYVVDRGGTGGMTFLAELGNTELRWAGAPRDLVLIRDHLQRVANNSRLTPGGGGAPRAPFAPSLSP